MGGGFEHRVFLDKAHFLVQRLSFCVVHTGVISSWCRLLAGCL